MTDNDLYALSQLKIQETYWMEANRAENLALVRSQIAAVEARNLDKIRSMRANPESWKPKPKSEFLSIPDDAVTYGLPQQIKHLKEREAYFFERGDYTLARSVLEDLMEAERRLAYRLANYGNTTGPVGLVA